MTKGPHMTAPRTKPTPKPKPAKKAGRGKEKPRSIKCYTFPQWKRIDDVRHITLYPDSHKQPTDVRMTLIEGHIGRDFRIVQIN